MKEGRDGVVGKTGLLTPRAMHHLLHANSSLVTIGAQGGGDCVFAARV